MSIQGSVNQFLGIGAASAVGYHNLPAVREKRELGKAQSEYDTYEKQYQEAVTSAKAATSPKDIINAMSNIPNIENKQQALLKKYPNLKTSEHPTSYDFTKNDMNMKQKAQQELRTKGLSAVQTRDDFKRYVLRLQKVGEDQYMSTGVKNGKL